MKDILNLSELDDAYIFDDATGDITISKEIAKRIPNDCDYVEVHFIDEPDQTHFPQFKVHRGFYCTRLEYIG